MADTTELERTNGAGTGADEVARPAAEGEQTRQPESKPRINLDELEDFRNWKSKMDTQVEQLKQNMTNAERRAYEAEQRIHEERMRGMDEQQRIAYENNLLRQQLQELNRQRQLEAYAYQKDQDIRRVASKEGLTYDELAAALPPGADSFVLWETARDLAAKKSQAPAPPAPRPAQQVNNHVDTGGRQPQSDTSRYQERYDRAMKSFNLDEALRVIGEASAAGVSLRE